VLVDVTACIKDLYETIYSFIFVSSHTAADPQALDCLLLQVRAAVAALHRPVYALTTDLSRVLLLNMALSVPVALW